MAAYEWLSKLHARNPALKRLKGEGVTLVLEGVTVDQLNELQKCIFSGGKIEITPMRLRT